MNNENAHLQAWAEKAGYHSPPFNVALYSECDPFLLLDARFTRHTGCFEAYSGPASTIILGAPGSGKTANCLQLEETLGRAPGVLNFVVMYDPGLAWPLLDEPMTWKHHLHEILRLGVCRLRAAKRALSSQDEGSLRELEAWCQIFRPKADYKAKLELLRDQVLKAGHSAIYVLVDERQSGWRQAAKSSELLSPLLDEGLFNVDNLYVKLFLPDTDRLRLEVDQLRREAWERVQMVELGWAEDELAVLLRALLRQAWVAGFHTSRAEELARLSLTMPDIDAKLVQVVAQTAPGPRALILLGQKLSEQCASRWNPGQLVTITEREWAAAVHEWHWTLNMAELVKRSAILVPLRLEFTRCTKTRAEVRLDGAEGLARHQFLSHKIMLPYKEEELWAVLWALERFAVHRSHIPADSPYIKTLRRLALIQPTGKKNALPVLVGDIAERVGERLYNCLFAKSGLERFLKENEEKVRQLDQGGIQDVRLWIELGFSEQTAGLARFPWELLRHAGVFMFQTGKYELTRHHHIQDRRTALHFSRPFRLLYIAPRPDASEIRRDYGRIERAFRPHALLEVRQVEPASYERLQQQIQDLTYQAFHFDGHGAFGRYNPDSGCFFPPWHEPGAAGESALLPLEGYLEFEDGKGGADLRPAGDLLPALYKAGSRLQLAVLNACKSSSADASLGGVAPALIRVGVPAVVGMLTSIEDQAAGDFIEAFYGVLGAALQTQNLSDQVAVRVLLQAMCEGRKCMIGNAQVPAARRCWWIPTLSLCHDI